ncbi:MAG: cell division protein FtsQ/DivIB [Xanthomonadales bacterium]
MIRRARQAPGRQRGLASGTLLVVLLFALTAVGVVWVGMGIVTSDRWPIRWLELNGEFQRVSAEQLRASLEPGMRAMRESAMANAWVSAVHVQKHWPDTVSVTVEEYEPVAHWNRGELIARDGRAFSVPEADGIQGLPWLEGPPTRLDDVLQTWVSLNERLTPLGLEVRHLAIDDRGSWSLELTNGTRVYLGRDSTDERLARLLGSWDALMEEQDVPPRGIDLRYTNGFAVSWPRDGADETRNGS